MQHFRGLKNSTFALTTLLFLSACASQDFDDSKENNKAPKLCRLAEKLSKQGNYQSALEIYNQAKLESPEDPEIQLSLARTLLSMGTFPQAEEELKKYIKTNPTNQDAEVDLLRALLEQQKVKEAEPLIQKLEKDKENEIEFITLKGVFYDLKGEHKQAQKVYLSGLSQSPNHHTLKANLGLSYAFDGAHTQAIQTLKEVSNSLYATSRDRHNLALAYGLSGNFTEAESIYRIDLSDADVSQNITLLREIYHAHPKSMAQESLTPIEVTKLLSLPTTEGASKQKEQHPKKKTHKKKIKQKIKDPA